MRHNLIVEIVDQLLQLFFYPRFYLVKAFVHLFPKIFKAAVAVTLGRLVNHRPSFLPLSTKLFMGSGSTGRVPHWNWRRRLVQALCPPPPVRIDWTGRNTILKI